MMERYVIEEYTGGLTQSLKHLTETWEFWSVDDLHGHDGQWIYRLFVLKEVQSDPKNSNAPWWGAVLIDARTDIADLLYIYIIPEKRQLGLANGLLKEVLALIAQAGADEIHLEVREHHERAKRLYERLGFQMYGIRQRYYENGDNACLYRRRLP